MRDSCPINALPNEILSALLAFLSARELTHLLPINRRFHAVIMRIIHRRLVDMSSLPHNHLILESYLPSAKLSTPTLSCKYLGLRYGGEEGFGANLPALVDLSRLYSAFQPVSVVESRPRRRTTVSPSGDQEPCTYETATQEISLHEDELFTQLCVSASVVKEIIWRGIQVCHVNICDGFIRVWRRWLAEQASLSEMGGKAQETRSRVDANEILWVDADRKVGLKFRVLLGPTERMPLLSGPDDDGPVSYTLVYKELIVRATALLEAVEATTVQEVLWSSKAVVIAQS